MTVIVLLAIVACVTAAPMYIQEPYPPFHQPLHQPLYQPPTFDQPYLQPFDQTFLQPFHQPFYQPYYQPFYYDNSWERRLQTNLMELNAKIADMVRHLPGISGAEITDSEYRLTIPLTGYVKNEITVEGNKRLLVIQAVHKVFGEPEHSYSYFDMRMLPDNVNVNGKWDYENGVLTIIFPLERQDQGVDIEPSVTQGPVTEAPEYSEEFFNNPAPSGDQNTDAGANRVDMGKDGYISNEIPSGQQTVEATTYAVDLKDVKLVPVHDFKMY